MQTAERGTSYASLTDDLLLDRLGAEEESLPRAALDEIARRGERLIPVLAALSGDHHAWRASGPSLWRAVHGAFGLAAIGGEKAVEGLLEALDLSLDQADGAITELLAAAAGALGRPALAPLLARARVGETASRALAIDALAAMADQHPAERIEIRASLAPLSEDESEEPAVRDAARAALPGAPRREWLEFYRPAEIEERRRRRREEEEDARWAGAEPAADADRRRAVDRFAGTLADLDEKSREQVLWLATTLIDFLAGARRAAPWRWSQAAASDYLEHFIRKTPAADPGVIALVPGALLRWARFWAGEGLLAPLALREVEDYLARVSRPFVRAALDRDNWEAGKALHLRLLADGVDPTDDRAVQGWIARYNSELVGSELPAEGPPEEARSRRRRHDVSNRGAD